MPHISNWIRSHKTLIAAAVLLLILALVVLAFSGDGSNLTGGAGRRTPGPLPFNTPSRPTNPPPTSTPENNDDGPEPHFNRAP